jgi:hypothetical protein
MGVSCVTVCRRAAHRVIVRTIAVSAHVLDVLSGTTALTTSTGTITLSFPPEGARIRKVQKLGFAPTTLAVGTSPRDTIPLTVVLIGAPQTLATFTTTDSAPRATSLGLRAFDERRRAGFGSLIVDSELRKNEHRTSASMVRRFPGRRVACSRAGPRAGGCFAVTTRRPSRYAVFGSSCEVDVYLDGVVSTDNDIERLKTADYAGVEYFADNAALPAQYNRTGSVCGVLLLCSQER